MTKYHIGLTTIHSTTIGLRGSDNHIVIAVPIKVTNVLNTVTHIAVTGGAMIDSETFGCVGIQFKISATYSDFTQYNVGHSNVILTVKIALIMPNDEIANTVSIKIASGIQKLGIVRIGSTVVTQLINRLCPQNDKAITVGKSY